MVRVSGDHDGIIRSAFGFRFATSGGAPAAMSILVEAISIVVPNAVLETHYPQGVEGFARDCPNGTFCSDGRISRVGFMSARDTGFFLQLLQACGLDHRSEGPAGNVVVVDQNTGPAQACLWLEFAHHEAGVALAWHAGFRPGRLVVPFGWDEDRIDAFRYAPNLPFPRRLRYLRTEDSHDWFQDRRTGELLCMESAFVTH